MQRTASLSSLALVGAAAGVAGGVLIDAYLLLTLVAISHVVTVGTFYRYVASGALGQAAYTDPNGVALGVLFHLLVSIGWGIGYAYMASRTIAIREHPATSAVVFGIVVMIAMQLVEVAANIYRLPNSFSLGNLFLAHVFFFGFPVAYLTRALMGRTATTAP